MSRFFSEKYQELKAYVPVELPPKKFVRLDTNESPYPASPFVYRSIDQFEIDNLRLYSDLESNKLLKAIADNFGVSENQVTVGNGSDELLSFSFMAFQNKEGKFYFPSISYGFYPVYADMAHVKREQIQLTESLSIRAADYFNLDGTIVISNPNTPTGLTLSVGEIEEILLSNKDNLVIIDEAYIDFGGESCIPLVSKYDNLLVIQTFSKSRNLAGARVGFAVSSPEVIEDLNRIKSSFNRYNLNRLSVIAATAAMKDKDYFKKCTNEVKKTRGEFVKEMEALGALILDSKANFVLVKIPSMTGEQYCDTLLEKNIKVKHYDNPTISDYVRISIGLPDAMRNVIKVTKSILGVEEQRD